MAQRYGTNALADQGAAGIGALVWASLRSPMMVLLLSIAAVSLLLRQMREAVAMAVVVLYVGIELLNKARADRNMARLRELQAPTTTVLRDGRPQEISVAEVTVGDVLLLRTGTRVPADARLLSASGLLVDESPPTGESSPQTKDAEAQPPTHAPLAERPTAVFAETTVLDGQGAAIVLAVGEGTELGRVAAQTARAGVSSTPLQREMRDLARTLAVVAIVVSALIPLIGWVRGYDLHQMLLTWLSLTFLMVPGQPPIIIAMALALASSELARRRVIVRRLKEAETLGSVTTILSDKTGTMTENRMALCGLILGDATVLPIGAASPHDVPGLADFLSGALAGIPEGSADPPTAHCWRRPISCTSRATHARGAWYGRSASRPASSTLSWSTRAMATDGYTWPGARSSCLRTPRSSGAAGKPGPGVRTCGGTY
jgi:P-type Ca2+ transporter type 2C